MYADRRSGQPSLAKSRTGPRDRCFTEHCHGRVEADALVPSSASLFAGRDWPSPAFITDRDEETRAHWRPIIAELAFRSRTTIRDAKSRRRPTPGHHPMP